MNYEQMYKEALERARSIRFGNPNSATANVVCEDIFPELKESEDERIRKALIEAIEQNYTLTGSINYVHTKDILAWLKKQDAQTIKEALRTEYEKGRYDMREEMMKEAINARISFGQQVLMKKPVPTSIAKDGDKVKLIIVKEER